MLRKLAAAKWCLKILKLPSSNMKKTFMQVKHKLKSK